MQSFFHLFIYLQSAVVIIIYQQTKTNSKSTKIHVVGTRRRLVVIGSQQWCFCKFKISSSSSSHKGMINNTRRASQHLEQLFKNVIRAHDVSRLMDCKVLVYAQELRMGLNDSSRNMQTTNKIFTIFLFIICIYFISLYLVSKIIENQRKLHKDKAGILAEGVGVGSNSKFAKDVRVQVHKTIEQHKVQHGKLLMFLS